MSYTVEIVIVRPPGPESDQGLPTFKLPDEYATILDAINAAKTYIKVHQYSLGEAWYHLFDHTGKVVVDSTRMFDP